MASYYKSRNKRQDKWQRELDKLARWRAAKKRKREEAIAAGWRPEPKMERAYRFELGVRDSVTGEVAFVPLKSVRDAARRLSLVLKFV